MRDVCHLLSILLLDVRKRGEREVSLFTPLREALSRKALPSKLRTIFLYFGMSYVLLRFSKFLGIQDSEKIGWLVLLALSADGMLDNPHPSWRTLYDLSLSHLSLSERAKEILREIWRAQIEDDGSVESALRKGGLTAQFHLIVLKQQVSKEEMDAAMKVGGFLQLFDDALDVIQDRREGVCTPFTSSSMNVRKLRKMKNSLISQLPPSYARIVKWMWSRRFLFKFLKTLLDLLSMTRKKVKSDSSANSLPEPPKLF